MAAYPHQIAVLLSAGAGKSLREILPGNIEIKEAPESTANPFYRYWFQRRHVPRIVGESGASVLFVPAGITGTRGHSKDFKLVTMLRNMLPFDRRERSRYSMLSYPALRFRLWLLSRALPATFRAADRLLFISEYSAGVVRPLVPDVDTRVIPHGVSGDVASATFDPAIPRRYGIGRRYVLYVSILDPYKHQLELIAGFSRFREASGAHKDLQLALAGPMTGAYANSARRAAESLQGAVICAGAVPSRDLPSLLKQAEALLFASTCETCPNILLEYLAAGRPIISSSTPPMPEFGGDAARYVDAENPDAWSAALTELYNDPKAMSELAARASERAKNYSWDETVRKTMAALTEW